MLFALHLMLLNMDQAFQLGARILDRNLQARAFLEYLLFSLFPIDIININQTRRD